MIIPSIDIKEGKVVQLRQGSELVLTDDYFEFRMARCPSLSKVLDNDASASPLYCDHCAAWIEPERTA